MSLANGAEDRIRAEGSQVGSSRIGEEDLFLAVLSRAVVDCFGPPSSHLHEVDIRQSRAFVRGGSRWFQIVCLFAGLEPEKVQAWAVQMEREGWPRKRVTDARRILRGDRSRART